MYTLTLERDFDTTFVLRERERKRERERERGDLSDKEVSLFQKLWALLKNRGKVDKRDAKFLLLVVLTIKAHGMDTVNLKNY